MYDSVTARCVAWPLFVGVTSGAKMLLCHLDKSCLDLAKMTAENPLVKDVFLAFQVIPRLKEGNNFEVVDKAIEVVKAASVPYQVAAMETTMRGELNHLLEIVKSAQQACYDAGALEVITNIKIHSKTEAATDTFCTYDRGVTLANHMFVKN